MDTELGSLTDFYCIKNIHEIIDLIDLYKKYLEKYPVKFAIHSIEDLLDLKRKKIKLGPYKNISLLEAANRIFSDFVILNFTLEAFKNEFNLYDTKYIKEIKINLGNKNGYDIQINTECNNILYGEAFNVAKSFYSPKLSNTLKKLRELPDYPKKCFIVHNNDFDKVNNSEIEIFTINGKNI